MKRGESRVSALYPIYACLCKYRRLLLKNHLHLFGKTCHIQRAGVDDAPCERAFEFRARGGIIRVMVPVQTHACVRDGGGTAQQHPNDRFTVTSNNRLAASGSGSAGSNHESPIVNRTSRIVHHASRISRCPENQTSRGPEDPRTRGPEDQRTEDQDTRRQKTEDRRK